MNSILAHVCLLAHNRPDYDNTIVCCTCSLSCILILLAASCRVFVVVVILVSCSIICNFINVVLLSGLSNEQQACRAAVSCSHVHADAQGYFLRNTPNPYLTAFAVMTAPNLCGQLLGPILSATGLYYAGKDKSAQPTSPQASGAEVDTAQNNQTNGSAQ